MDDPVDLEDDAADRETGVSGGSGRVSPEDETGTEQEVVDPESEEDVYPRFEVPQQASSSPTDGPEGARPSRLGAAGETDTDETPFWADVTPPLSSEQGGGSRRQRVKEPSKVLPSFERPQSSLTSEPPKAGIARTVYPTFETPKHQPTVAPGLAGIAATVLPTFEEPSLRGADGLAELRASTRTGHERGPLRRQERRRDDSGLGGIEGPEYDQEMPLSEHIEEMIKRLAVVIVIAGSVSLVTFPFADQVINFLWFSILPEGELAQPRVYGPLDFLLTQIKVASLAGLIIALPVLVYETYAFMRPGLYPNERKYYLAAIPSSLILAIIGIAFAYFIILPALFTYFLFYSQDAGSIAFALVETVDLILILMAYLAIVFQIPLFIMLAIMMGLVTRRWLAEKRLYFWGAFLGIAFLSSPDPTGMAPIVIALTMVGLYEGTLAVLKWVGR